MKEVKREIQTPEDGYYALVSEIIKTAFRDYGVAIIKGDEKAMAKSEAWFRGPVFAKLTMAATDPEWVIEEARRVYGCKTMARPVSEGD